MQYIKEQINLALKRNTGWKGDSQEMRKAIFDIYEIYQDYEYENNYCFKMKWHWFWIIITIMSACFFALIAAVFMQAFTINNMEWDYADKMYQVAKILRDLK